MFIAKKIIIALGLPFLLINGSIFAGKKGKKPACLSKISEKNAETSQASLAEQAEKKEHSPDLKKQIQQLVSKQNEANVSLRQLQSEKKELLLLHQIGSDLLNRLQDAVSFDNVAQKTTKQLSLLQEEITNQRKKGKTFLRTSIDIERNFDGNYPVEDFKVSITYRPKLIINNDSSPRQIAENIQLHLLEDLFCADQTESTLNKEIQAASYLMSSENLTIMLLGKFSYFLGTKELNGLNKFNVIKNIEFLMKKLKTLIKTCRPQAKKLTIQVDKNLNQAFKLPMVKQSPTLLKFTQLYLNELNESITSFDSRINDITISMRNIQSQQKSLEKELALEKKANSQKNKETLTHDTGIICRANPASTDNATPSACAANSNFLCDESTNTCFAAASDALTHDSGPAACVIIDDCDSILCRDTSPCSADATPVTGTPDCVYAIPITCNIDQVAPQTYTKDKSMHSPEKSPAALPASAAQETIIPIIKENPSFIEIETPDATYMFYKLYPSDSPIAQTKPPFTYDTTPGRPGDYIGKWNDIEKQAQYPNWFENDRTCLALGRQTPHLLFKAIPECADLLLESNDIVFKKIYVDHNNKNVETLNMIGCIIPKLKMVDDTTGLMPRIDCVYTWGFKKQKGRTICYHRCAEAIAHAEDLLEKVKAQNKKEKLPAEWDEADFPALATSTSAPVPTSASTLTPV